LSRVNRVLRCSTIALVVSAFAFTGALLIGDLGVEILQESIRSLISALSLLLVGVAFLIVQPMMQLRTKELLRNALLAATFILWGAVQLMPQGVLSLRVSSIVVVLFVLDLGLVILSAGPTREPKLPWACVANCCARQVSDEKLSRVCTCYGESVLADGRQVHGV
jgi:hypothetical protein